MTSVTSLIHLLSASRARRREQWLDPESLADRRRQRLHRLARVARAAPYYRELFDRAGMTPVELTEATLVELPLLDKPQLHAAGPADMVTENPRRLSAVTTSGSTSEPLRVVCNSRDQAEVSGVWSRALGAFGHGLFDRQVNVNTGQAVAKSGPVVLLRRLGLLPRIQHLSSFDESLRGRSGRRYPARADREAPDHRAAGRRLWTRRDLGRARPTSSLAPGCGRPPPPAGADSV